MKQDTSQGGDRVAYYVWTNTQLINAVQARTKVYQSDSAVLFVLMLDRVTGALVDRIQESAVFERVYRIVPPQDFSAFPKLLRWLCLPFYGGAYQRYFEAYAGGENIDLFLTGGYWAYALFLLRAIYHKAPHVRVVLLEEGIGSYYRTLERSCQIWPRSGLKERLLRLVYFGSFANTAKKKVSGILVYQPQQVHSQEIAHLRLPQLDVKQDIFRRIFSVWTETDAFQKFSKADAYLFVLPRISDRVSKSDSKIWGAIQGRLNSVLRLEHPENAGADVILFETICVNSDISDRLLIGFCSSCMLTPKYWFDQEPYVIFTYRTGAYDDSRLSIPEADTYVNDLRAAYREPQKVMVPNSIGELQALLAQVRREQEEAFR